MKLQVTFRHMDPSDALREYLERKTARFAKIADKLIELHAVYAQEKLDTELELFTTLYGHTIKTVERGADPYAVTDVATEKIERQIHRVRDRMLDRNKQGRTREIG